MPSRKGVWPGSGQGDRRREIKPQSSFNDVFEDCAPTLVPDTALAKCINCWPQKNYVRPRNGTTLYGASYPAIENRTGYTAHKVGYTIISDSGNIFTEEDVSNIWVWDNGLTDEITGYTSATVVTCRDNDANTGINCHLQGKVNLNQWHDKSEKWVVQLGNNFYTAERDKGAYTKVLSIGRDLPTNAISEMIEDGDDAIVQNAKYMYRILLTANPIRSFPMSTPVPTNRIVSNDNSGEKNHKYHYVYSCSTIEQGGGNFYHRESLKKIQIETGINIADENRRDWAIVNTENNIGPAQDVYGVLTGGSLAAIWTDPDNVGSYLNLYDMTFQININGLGVREIIVDVHHIAGEMSMNDIAKKMELAIRVYFPTATCEYVTNITVGSHFKITSGIVKGGSVSYAVEGISGTPSGANLVLTSGGGSAVTSPYVGQPNIVRGLYLPRVQNTLESEYQWHHTHYSIYRTYDIGPLGVSDASRKASVYTSHLNERGKRVVNSPDEFVWDKDLRVAGSFIARRYDGYIELRSDDMGGEFELADEGSVIEFEDGSREELLSGGFVNSKKMQYDDTPYYNDESIWMAAEIGNGRCLRITQAGAIVTIVAGSSATSYTAFVASDVRKMVWFPNGTRDWIKRVISATSVEMYTSGNKTETAMTFQPTHRNYSDAVYDDKLQERTSAWFCKNRFMREVKPSNLIISQPGFIVMAARGGKEIRYCPLEPSYKYFLGYHVREHQTIENEDVVERLVGFTNRYSALCKGAIYSGATNNSIEYTIPETFQKIWILSGIERISKIGLISYGGMDWIDDDWVRLITNTGELRDFNGVQFRSSATGEPVDYANDTVNGLGRFSNAIKKAYKSFSTKYARGVGFVMWWKDTE